MQGSNKIGKVALILAVVLITAGCLAAVEQALAADSASPAPAASPAGGKVQLKLGWMVGPDNLNPFIGYQMSSYEIWSLNYDILFNPYPDGSFGPQLAAEIPTVENGGIAEGGRVWTVKIRPNVKWQDDKPLTAEDVAFSYNYVIKGGLWNFSFLVQGIERVEVVDPTTVRFVCSKPKADMIYAFVYIIPRHIWENVKPGVAQNSYISKPPIVGSGPFQVVESKKDNYVKMVRNPDYWGPQPTVDEVYFMTYQNADTMVQELKNGTIDGCQGVPQAQDRALRDDGRFGTAAYNLYAWDYLAFNCYEGTSKGNPALRDREVRRALSMAIDRDKLVSVAHGGLATPGTTLVNPDTWVDPDWHWQPPAEQMLSFDLEKAKQTLEAAGYKDTNGDGVREGRDGQPIKLRLWASSDVPATQSEGKLIAGWWKEIGIDVELAVVNQGTIDDAVWNYEGATYAPDYDCIVVASSGFLDPGLTLDMYTKAQIQNWNDACWWNPEYDKLAAGVSTQMDTGQRKQDIDRMQEIFYEDAPTSVLTYPKELEAYNTDEWTGWTPLMVGGQPGPVFGTSANPETYLNLKPVTKSADDSGGTSTTTIVIVVVAALVVVAVIVGLVVRRRAGKKAVEEA